MIERRLILKKAVILLFVFGMLIFLAACISENPRYIIAMELAPTDLQAEKIITPVVTIETGSTLDSNLTMGQLNALTSAKSYLNIMPFSRNELINQLEYENYSHQDAVFAVDHSGANWHEQALKEAISYLDFAAFSYSRMIKQLEFEGYTNEQATYAAKRCGADWFEQAAKSAESYLSLMSFSRDDLIKQLEFEGFTTEQAIYGVEANGY
jgi:hypothetical protein